MGLIKEPLDIDFIVDSRPLTKQQQLMISEYIKADKAKRDLLKKSLLKKRSSMRKKANA